MMYRLAENPHKKAYDRKDSLRRLRKSTPKTIREQRGLITHFRTQNTMNLDEVYRLQDAVGDQVKRFKALAVALAVAVLAIGALWIRGSFLEAQNEGLLALSASQQLDIEDLTRERDSALESSHEHWRDLLLITQENGECRRDLIRASSRVMYLERRVEQATSQVRENSLRIELLERSCFE